VKVVLFANNLVGLRSVEMVQKHGDTIVAIVVHAKESSRYRDEILAALNQPHPVVIEADSLRNRETVEQIEALRPDVGLSAFFGHILRPEIINIFPLGIVNIHPAYLPYNRGAYPNVWSIVDKTPAGVTIHYVDKGVDSGNIIDQVEIEVTPEDTGESLYDKLEKTCIELLARSWPGIAEAPAKVKADTQDSSEGTSHRVRDTDDIDLIDLDKTYRAGDLLDIIRSRTFPGFHGAYFEQDSEKYFLRIEIEKESTQDDNS